MQNDGTRKVQVRKLSRKQFEREVSSQPEDGKKANALPTHWYFRNERLKHTHYDEGGLSSEVETILYVGGFALPDENAAAQRVVANAKLFSEIGYNVAFINYAKSSDAPQKKRYFDFECFECPEAEWRVASRLDVDRIEEILEMRPDITTVVAYNYPAVALARLIRLCRRRKVTCIGDVTEWYRARDVAFPNTLLKYIDTTIRMRFLHPRMDGLIVISEYLKNYYGARVPTILLPPLVDILDEKWLPLPPVSHKDFRLVYAGKPSKTKERLDLIAKAVVSLPEAVDIRLDIVGVTADEFKQIYGYAIDDKRVVFHGRISHNKAIEYVKQANYSVIIRDDNRVTRAGFPTKFAESVSCGTPVICNDNSDLKEWIDKFACGIVTSRNRLAKDIESASNRVSDSFNRNVFDFRNYLDSADAFVELLKMKGKKNAKA